MYYDPKNGNHVAIDGMIVERDALRIAEKIKDYDENLEILCNTRPSDDFTEAPYIICERVGDSLVKVFDCWELNDLVIARLQLADRQTTDLKVHLESLKDDWRKKTQARYQEWREEAQDVVKHIAGMKSKYSFKDANTGDVIHFYDDRPASRRTDTTTITLGSDAESKPVPES